MKFVFLSLILLFLSCAVEVPISIDVNNSKIPKSLAVEYLQSIYVYDTNKIVAKDGVTYNDETWTFDSIEFKVLRFGNVHYQLIFYNGGRATSYYVRIESDINKAGSALVSLGATYRSQ